MLTNTVIIILREVLEAAYLSSFLLAISVFMQIRFKWFYCALIAGGLGAFFYAYHFERISEWFDYSGQEIVNAVLQLLVFLCLLVLILVPKTKTRWGGGIVVCMFIAVFLGLVREGAELIIYYSGFSHVNESIPSLVTGSIIGGGIGLSVGALIYFSLLSLPRKQAWLFSRVMLLITANGLLGQAVGFLIQADIIPSQAAAWNSSSLLAEDSVLGQLLYAMIAYESTPELSQLMAWLGGFFLVAGLYAVLYKKGLYTHVAS